MKEHQIPKEPTIKGSVPKPKRFKNTDDVQSYFEYLRDEPIHCQESVDYTEQFIGNDMLTTAQMMVSDEYKRPELVGWFQSALYHFFEILPTDVRKIYTQYIMDNSEGTRDLQLMMVYRRNKPKLTKSEKTFFKNYIKGRLPNQEIEGEFDGS